jgi:hypothetical protein
MRELDAVIARLEMPTAGARRSDGQRPTKRGEALEMRVARHGTPFAAQSLEAGNQCQILTRVLGSSRGFKLRRLIRNVGLPSRLDA